MSVLLRRWVRVHRCRCCTVDIYIHATMIRRATGMRLRVRKPEPWAVRANGWSSGTRWGKWPGRGGQKRPAGVCACARRWGRGGERTVWRRVAPPSHRRSPRRLPTARATNGRSAPTARMHATRTAAIAPTLARRPASCAATCQEISHCRPTSAATWPPVWPCSVTSAPLPAAHITQRAPLRSLPKRAGRPPTFATKRLASSDQGAHHG